MVRFRLREGVIDQLKTDHRFDTDEQVAAALSITVEDVEAIRRGAPITPVIALRVAIIQGSQFDLSPWVAALQSNAA